MLKKIIKSIKRICNKLKNLFDKKNKAPFIEQVFNSEIKFKSDFDDIIIDV